MDVKKLIELAKLAECLSSCESKPGLPDTHDVRKERPVLVCTEYRGVFFGYATDTDGETIRLRAARCALYWSKDVGGFIGLAGKGPTSSCRIGAKADLELRKITCVLEVTESAMKAWESVACVS